MNTIHLQGIGRVTARPAGELNVGDVTIWNYGYREVVESITPTGKQSVTVVIRNAKTGEAFTRTMRRTRLVGITA